jgi:SAM-dependent methyltransferase
MDAGHLADLLADWIPALDGVAARLTAGARVAVVGCGNGTTTVLMARRFPASTFHGFDDDRGSIERARAGAIEAGVGDRVSFEVCAAAAIPALGYDLVCTFDALHDHGHPDAAARRVRECLLPGGSWMLVEPRAGEAALRAVLTPAGFGDVRVTAGTPFTTVLQARVLRE